MSAPVTPSSAVGRDRRRRLRRRRRRGDARARGLRDVTVFERGERVGGVWHHNTYPGAACDVPSHLYEFSFAPNPRWSRRYAPQAEIQAYLEDVARRYGVLDRIRTGTEVDGARWDEERGTLDARDQRRPARGRRPGHRLRPAVGADGAADPGPRRASPARASTPRGGATTSTSTGKRVAVVGTGCSAIQVVPAIQPIVEQVDVYQRSPGWTFPKMDFAYSRARASGCSSASRRCSGSTARRSSPSMELGAAAMTSQPLAAAAVRAPPAAGRSTRRSTTPSCAAR